MVARKPIASILIAEQSSHTRRLLADVLSLAGFQYVHHAEDGEELLARTVELQPRIVITTSRLPRLSGLEFTRMVRAGVPGVPRTLSIIVMTDTPTKTFLDAARDSGVDEILSRPFTAKALLMRIQAVLKRPRVFVDSAVYVGPCRRRRMVGDYVGPLRRFLDPVDESTGALPWESESSRVAVRKCVQRISECARHLKAHDRRKLRDIYFAAKETEMLADQTRDDVLGNAARSLGRYLSSIGANGAPEPDVVRTHIDAMHSLGLLTSAQYAEREQLLMGLVRMVDKKLGRTQRLGAQDDPYGASRRPVATPVLLGLPKPTESDPDTLELPV